MSPSSSRRRSPLDRLGSALETLLAAIALTLAQWLAAETLTWFEALHGSYILGEISLTAQRAGEAPATTARLGNTGIVYSA